MRLHLVPCLGVLAGAAGLARAETFTVTSLADPGDGVCDATCTLREAIDAANGTDAADDIQFTVQGKIAVQSALPFVQKRITLSGAGVTIDGGGLALSTGLAIASGGAASIIRGIAVVGFSEGVGIAVLGANVQLLAVRAGVEADGMTANENGIGIRVYADNCTINGTDALGPSVVSGNGGTGIYLDGAHGTAIQRTYVGVGVDGNTAIPNSVGISAYGASNVVVAGLVAKPNIVAANEQYGFYVADTTGLSVTYTRIGVGADGETALSNTNGLFAANTTGVTIRWNVVSGNGSGLWLNGVTGATIEGNLIGTDVSGLQAVPNETGIYVKDGKNVKIGGPTYNVISGNSDTGIYISGGEGLIIDTNWIGTDADREEAVPNGYGIRIFGGGAPDLVGLAVSGNLMGGIDVSGTNPSISGCRIGQNLSGDVLGNGAFGVRIAGASSGSVSGNEISGSQVGVSVLPDATGVVVDSIFLSNGGLGIDLSPAGRNANDDGDGDTGANGNQNHAVLATAVTSGTLAIVKGTLDSKPSTTYSVRFFVEKDGECASSIQPSEAPYTGVEITTDAEGHADLTTYVSGGAGELVSTTVTGPDGTSEPSPCVAVEACAMALGPEVLPAGRPGEPYDAQLTTTGTGRSVTFFVIGGTLPAGVTVSFAGKISGTPTAEGTFVFMVRAIDDAGCQTEETFTIVVGACDAITVSPALLPDATRGAPYQQTLTAEGGTGARTFAVTSGSLPSGLTLSSGGVLSGTSSSSGTSSFTVTATDAEGCTGARAYELTVSCGLSFTPASLADATTGTPYGATFVASGGSGVVSFAVTGGALPAGLMLSSGGNLSGTPSATGDHEVQITATDGGGCTASRTYELDVSCPSIVLAPVSLAAATAGAAYSATLVASGGTGPHAYAISSGAAPSGLTLGAATGLLAGTPDETGTASFTVSATDAYGCAGSRAYELVTSCPAFQVRPTTLPPATTLASYDLALATPGATAPVTFTVAAGELPSGMSLSTAGVFAGTPGTQGMFDVTVGAVDAHGCAASRAYDLLVTGCPTITVSPATLPGGAVGAAYTGAVTASGGREPYALSVSDGTLPAGVTLSADGDLTGTLSFPGSSTFTIAASDADGCTGTREYDVVVAPVAVNVDAGPGTPDAAAPDAGTSDAAAPAPDAGATPDAQAQAEEPADPTMKDGCGCRVGGRGPSGALFVLAALAFRLRRRARGH